jgi:glycosyltransferase involved in cell wall biosynthesis
MACGTPVVTTRLTSLPEVAGEAALYVDPEDADDLASALTALAGSSALRLELSERGRERAALFDWNRSAERMDSLFATLL